MSDSPATTVGAERVFEVVKRNVFELDFDLLQVSKRRNSLLQEVKYLDPVAKHIFFTVKIDRQAFEVVNPV